MFDEPDGVSLFDLYQLVPVAEELDLAYEAQAARDQRELDRLLPDRSMLDGEWTFSLGWEPDADGVAPALPPDDEAGWPAERLSAGQVQGLLEHMLGAQVLDEGPGAAAD